MTDPQPPAAPKPSTDSADTTPEATRSDVTPVDATPADTSPADAPVETVVDESPAVATPDEPVAATTDPAAVDTGRHTAPAERVVYVTAPTAPTKKGNRGVGSLIALLSAVVYAALLAVALLILTVIAGGQANFDFVTNVRFYIPVLFYVVGLVLLVLVLNRASWWPYIIGSLLVGVLVYFGSIGLGLVATGIIQNTPDEAAARYALELRNPGFIIAALLAREVAMWTGAIIASRGRKVKARNIEAREAFDRELAEKRAAHDRPATDAASTAR